MPADDARWQKIMPPNGWNCRCYIVARLRSQAKGVDTEAMRAKVDEYFTTKEWERCRAQGFGINRAVEADVFTANQMYINKFPNMAGKLMDKITPQEWGLNNSLRQLMNRADETTSEYEGTWQDWFDSHKNIVGGKETLQIKDYNGRTWEMDRNSFAAHNRTQKHAGRTQYLDCLPDIMSKPDEVWLGRQLPFRTQSSGVLDSLVMIKYYKNAVLAAAGNIQDGKLILRTWYKVEKNHVRSGILIKK